MSVKERGVFNDEERTTGDEVQRATMHPVVGYNHYQYILVSRLCAAAAY